MMECYDEGTSAGRRVTEKPFGLVPFEEHVELLRLFLAHREDIVESIEPVLNAQRSPTRHLQEPSLLPSIEHSSETKLAISAVRSLI